MLSPNDNGGNREVGRNSLRLGLAAWTIDLSAPDVLATIAKETEACGFHTLWLPDHAVLPNPKLESPPLDPDFPLLDPLVALAFVATVTDRLRLGTGVIVLPQHHPLALAKQLVTLDVLSGGRLTFGFGVGYLEPELKAFGVPMSDRGSRADEYLAAMICIWTQELASFHGRYVAFEGVTARPQPLQRPYPPIVVGGASEAAHRRALKHCQAWYGYKLTYEETTEHLKSLTEKSRTVPRPPDAGPLGIIITPSEPIDRDAARRFADLGVDELALVLPVGTPAKDVIDFLRRSQDELLTEPI